MYHKESENLSYNLILVKKGKQPNTIKTSYKEVFSRKVKGKPQNRRHWQPLNKREILIIYRTSTNHKKKMTTQKKSW